MTRRERLEARAERRTEWAEKASARSDAAFSKASAIADGIPFGQPILVGHHSEAGHRRDLDRIQSGMRTGCEEAGKVKHHEEKARGLERQLRTSIFSDDEDAVPAPDGDILDALRDAGFRWASGSWVGRRESLPPCVTALTASLPAKEPQP